MISRQTNDLRLAIHGTTDQITIQNWYTSPPTNQIEDLKAVTGNTYSIRSRPTDSGDGLLQPTDRLVVGSGHRSAAAAGAGGVGRQLALTLKI